MNIKISQNKPNLTVYDKDNLLHATDIEIMNIDITKSKLNSPFEKAIKIISNLKQLTETEYKVYRYLILDCISKGFEMKDSTIIDLNKYVITEMSNKLNLCYATIYRMINNLVDKNILTYLCDSKCNPIRGKYIFINNFDISRFRNNELKVITITL